MDRLISEKAVLKQLKGCLTGGDTEYEYVKLHIDSIPSAEPKTEQWKDFAVFVAKEIFDYEWEYNKDAFAEIACRKLAKLGIVRAKDDEWELVEPQESEVKAWID